MTEVPAKQGMKACKRTLCVPRNDDAKDFAIPYQVRIATPVQNPQKVTASPPVFIIYHKVRIDK